MDRVRIGILGAARIVPTAVLDPAQSVPRLDVAAIAARDQSRAHAFAAKYGIRRVHATYDAVLADSTIDAVYIPLPNGLHGQWAIKALEAGKHVLCEKPFAANAAEAQLMARTAHRVGRVLMEAFHYRYHPLAARMKSVVTSGALGRIQHVDAALCFPIVNRHDIRFRYDLAGGATMDAGAYTINILRFLAGQEPDVNRACARLITPQVDRRMSAEFLWAHECTGRMTCSLLSTTLLKINVNVQGEHGSMSVINPFVPHRYHRLTVRTDRGEHVEQLSMTPTYVYQMRAFMSAILEGAPIITDPADAINNMRIIDAVYDKAGLERRSPTTG